MTVIQFPSRRPPTPQQVLEVVYRFSSQRRWTVESHQGEDGQPYVEATARTGEAVLGFHWAPPGKWAVFDINGKLIDEDTDLQALMAAHIV